MLVDVDSKGDSGGHGTRWIRGVDRTSFSAYSPSGKKGWPPWITVPSGIRLEGSALMTQGKKAAAHSSVAAVRNDIAEGGLDPEQFNAIWNFTTNKII